MSKILVTCASNYGSTREIVEGIGEVLRESDLQVDDIYWINMSTDLGRAAAARGEMGPARLHAQEALRLARQVHSATRTARNEPLLKELDSILVSPQSPPELAPEGFSRRQLEVLRWLESDLTGPEIADHLVVSLNTVRFHTKNIYQKLGVNTRLEAIRRAKELGL